MSLSYLILSRTELFPNINRKRFHWFFLNKSKFLFLYLKSCRALDHLITDADPDLIQPLHLIVRKHNDQADFSFFIRFQCFMIKKIITLWNPGISDKRFCPILEDDSQSVIYLDGF